MNAVALHELRLHGYIGQCEIDERDVETLRKLGVHRGKRFRVGRAIVRWNLNSCNRDASTGALTLLDHLRQVVAQSIDRLPAKTVVTAELDHHDRGRILLEHPRQARKTAGRG